MFKLNSFKAATILLSGFVVAGGSLLSPVVLAQDASSVPLEEIIVTATKRSQALADIPMSVSVLGGDVLERRQAINFESLVALVPGLSIQGNAPGETRPPLAERARGEQGPGDRQRQEEGGRGDHQPQHGA